MVIQVENLTKRYGPTLAVDGISFEVAKGEIVGVLGPNGAGKSTIMRILTCFMPATSGEARVLGRDVFSESEAVRRSLGYMPESVPLYPDLRVVEYLRYRSAVKGVPRKARRARVEEVVDRCGVRDVQRKLIGRLSKGYRQRVGLADALVADPPLLILDEPTIGLDPNQIRTVRSMIRELGEDRTILLSTHILPEVEATCDRVLIIHNGRIVYNRSLQNEGRREGDVLIEARGPADQVEALLRSVAGVERVRPEPRRGDVCAFRLTCRRGVDIREEAAQRIAAKGWGLRELRREREALEDVFVRFTTGDAGAGDET